MHGHSHAHGHGAHSHGISRERNIRGFFRPRIKNPLIQRMGKMGSFLSDGKSTIMNPTS